MHPIDEEFLELLRYARQKEVEMWSIVRELIGYFFFILIIYLISYGNRDPMSFRYKQHLEYNFIKKNNFTTVRMVVGFFFISHQKNCHLNPLDCDLERLVGVGALDAGPRAEGSGPLQRAGPVRPQGLHRGPHQQDHGIRHTQTSQGHSKLLQVRGQSAVEVLVVVAAAVAIAVAVVSIVILLLSLLKLKKKACFAHVVLQCSCSAVRWGPIRANSREGRRCGKRKLFIIIICASKAVPHTPEGEGKEPFLPSCVGSSSLVSYRHFPAAKKVTMNTFVSHKQGRKNCEWH